MKIKPEHYERMKSAMLPLAEKIAPHREQVLSTGKFTDLEKRIRWDVMRAAGLTLFLCDTLYSYVNDEHIDTALRAIMREIEPTLARDIAPV